MTKEQFLNGTSFFLPNKVLRSKDTYVYRDGSILRQTRHTDNKVLFDIFEANIEKMGRVGFEAYTFVLDKKVVVKFRFEDLEEAN